MILSYGRLHIRSGFRAVQPFCVDQYGFTLVYAGQPKQLLTRQLALELVNRWNTSHPGVWQYWLA